MVNLLSSSREGGSFLNGKMNSTTVDTVTSIELSITLLLVHVCTTLVSRQMTHKFNDISILDQHPLLECLYMYMQHCSTNKFNIQTVGRPCLQQGDMFILSYASDIFHGAPSSSRPWFLDCIFNVRSIQHTHSPIRDTFRRSQQ